MVTVGLKTLYTGENSTVDIVAVHGLGANPDWAWIRKTGRRDVDGLEIVVNWLRDLDMLPSQLPHSRIMTFSYESQWILGDLKQRQSLCAIQLLTALDNQRNEEPDTKHRPIVFIGHSFGGIVIEEATRQAWTKTQFNHLILSTVGALFLGTPHRGSAVQKWGQIVARSVKALCFHADNSIMKSLSMDSELLIDLLDDFVTLAKKHSIEIICCFEQHKTDYAKGRLWGSEVLSRMVVEEASACIPGYQKVPLATDHCKINKYSGPDDEAYQVVYPLLKRIVRDALHSQGMAESLVNRNQVEEHNYRPLPLAQLGTDLKQLETEYLRNLEEMDDVRDGLRYYIPAEGTQRPGSQERFDLSNRVKEFLSHDVNQKVFLILGPAGSGKSTFNHYLARKLWKEYDSQPHNAAIPLFIALASLTREMDGGDLIGMYLKEHQFSEEQIGLLQRTREFVFILDGYDEIRHRDGNFYNQNMLDKWRAKVILASRPEYLGSGYESKFHPLQKPRLLQQCWLAPLSRSATIDYIQRFVDTNPGGWTLEQYTGLINLSEVKSLIGNPFLLSITMSIAPKLPPGKFNRPALYKGFIKDWLDRSQKRLNNIQLTEVERQAFRRLSEEGYTTCCLEYCQRFALALYRHQLVEVTYSSIRLGAPAGESLDSEWATLFLDAPEERIVRFNAPLFRQENRYRFIHKSIRDYLVSRAILDNNIKKPHAEALLNQFDLVNDPAVLNFIVECVRSEPGHRLPLIEYVERSKLQAEVQRAAANAITILNRAGRQFSGTDLSGIKVAGADLSFGVFDHTNLEQADLRCVNFSGAWLSGANLSRSLMSGVLFGERPYMVEQSTVSCCCFSPDGKIIASSSEYNIIRLWSVEDQQRVQTLNGDINRIHDLVFSPDGKTLAAAGEGSNIQLWSVEEQRLIQTFESDAYEVTSVAYSPDGKILASASDCGTVELWSVEEQRLVQTLKVGTGEVTSVAFSPDGQTVAAASWLNTVQLWSFEEQRLVRMLSGHEGTVKSVTFSPDGRMLASSSDDNTVRLWSIEDQQLVQTLEGHTAAVTKVVYSPDGKMLASASGDWTVRLWSVEEQRHVQTLEGHTGWVNSVVYSPDGKTLASASEDRTARLWSVEEQQYIQPLEVHTDVVSIAIYSPDGKMLALAGEDDTVRLWSVEDQQLVQTLEGHTGEIHSVVYSPDGKTLASASSDQTVRLWSVDEQRLVQTLEGHTDTVICVAFSPDGKTLASASGDNIVRLWSVEEQRLVRELEGHRASVYSVAFLPDGKRVASSSYDRTVRLWSLEEQRLVQTLKGHTAAVTKVVYSPDGKMLASASKDWTVRLWSVEEQRLVQTLEGHEGGADIVVYSPDGKILATTNENTVRLWSVEEGRLVQPLEGHTKWFDSVAFSPDGKTVVAAGYDHTVRLWSVEEQRLVQTLEVHPEEVTSVMFSPDGETLVSVCSDGTIRLWSMIRGQYITRHEVFSILGRSDPSLLRMACSNSPAGSQRPRNRHLATLIWKSPQTELTVARMCIDGVQGLSDTNKRLLMQRGATPLSNYSESKVL